MSWLQFFMVWFFLGVAVLAFCLLLFRINSIDESEQMSERWRGGDRGL